MCQLSDGVVMFTSVQRREYLMVRTLDSSFFSKFIVHICAFRKAKYSLSVPVVRTTHQMGYGAIFFWGGLPQLNVGFVQITRVVFEMSGVRTPTILVTASSSGYFCYCR